MIITSIRLKNFRQFAGVQEIDLEANGDNTKNVIVIFGENGRGKTGIFRALMFCLYGIKRLSQDADITDDALYLVNTAALEANKDTPVECYVELKFEHEGSHYSVKRSLTGLFDGSATFEEEGEKSGLVTLPDGNSKIITAENLDTVIRSILDPRVKDYFLFDGEKIERLTRASIEQKHEVSAGIRNLLNIDSLQNSITALKKLGNEINNDLQNSSNEKLVQVFQKLRKNEEDFAKLEENETRITDEMIQSSSQLAEIDRDLDKISGIRSLLEERKLLEKDRSRLEDDITELLSNLKGHIPKVSNLLMKNVLQGTFQTIEQKKKKGEIPSIIRKELIQQILESNTCICGNEVCEGSVSYNAISEWLAKATDKEEEDELLDVWSHLGSVIRNFEENSENINSVLIEYGKNKSMLREINSSLDEVGEKIGDKDRQDAFDLEEIRKRIIKDQVALQYKLDEINGQKEEKKAENERLQNQLKDEKAKSDLNDEITQRSILVRETLNALNDVYSTFTEEIKDKLGKSATELFNRLIDREGKRVLSKIIVNQDYSLEILDKFGKTFLANISAGQRQIMSISFISALAQAASNGNQINIPLFMDTPFGRLSYDHRKNLINEIPNLSSQWILLATDTEFRREEARILQRSERWGKFFLLQPTEDGATQIVEKDINAAITLLQERSEENLK